MQAYEFYATPENGAIKIPEQYRNTITTGVKVIILEQKFSTHGCDKARAQNKSDLLLSPTTATNGWKFNREDANAR